MRSESRPTQQRSTAEPRPVLALKPLSASGNDFSGLFSSHIDADSFERVAFDWDDLGRGRYDVVVFHWPTEFFRPDSRKATLKLFGRMLRDRLLHGTRFVWVVHNLEPHDGGSMSSQLTSGLFLRLLSGVILLSQHSRSELHRLYPSTRSLPTLLTVHGRYEFANPPRDALLSGRQNRLLFFGLIREYKNVERLVSEARGVGSQPFVLTVIGACKDEELKARIEAAARGDDRIRLDVRDAVVPEAELERVIDDHDAVILPYRNILNSGVALHSLGRNKPILAPAIGSLPELQATVGPEWVSLFHGDISAAAIERFLEGLAKLDAPRPDLSAFAWDRIGSDVTRFLKSLWRE